MSHSRAEKLKRSREELRRLSQEILLDHGVPVEERLVELIYATEWPMYSFQKPTIDEIRKNDKRLELMRKTANHTIAVVRYSYSGLVGSYNSYYADGPCGEGLAVGKLDEEQPWTLVQHRGNTGYGVHVHEDTVLLQANFQVEGAVGLHYSYYRSHDRVAGGESYLSPCYRALTEPHIKLPLPTDPVGAESFTRRLDDLQGVAGCGMEGIGHLADEVQSSSGIDQASKTLVLAALKHFGKGS
jgi:hypothetical protein